MEIKNIYKDSILYTGTVKLEITRPSSETQIHAFEQNIRDSKELVLNAVGGSSIGGNIFVISTAKQEPVWLLEELLLRAKELGYQALALTDHNNLCGAMCFARLTRSLDMHGITGAELTLQKTAVDALYRVCLLKMRCLWVPTG
jgi:hypothetical protein